MALVAAPRVIAGVLVAVLFSTFWISILVLNQTNQNLSRYNVSVK